MANVFTDGGQGEHVDFKARMGGAGIARIGEAGCKVMQRSWQCVYARPEPMMHLSKSDSEHKGILGQTTTNKHVSGSSEF